MTKTERAIITRAYEWAAIMKMAVGARWMNNPSVTGGLLFRAVTADKRAKKKGGK